MSQFLITHGPDPRVRCGDCDGDARVADYFPHPPRPADFEAIKRLHACGLGPWDLLRQEPRTDEELPPGTGATVSACTRAHLTPGDLPHGQRLAEGGPHGHAG